MTEPNFSVNFTAAMLATEACAIGDLLVYHQSVGVWKVATTANRTAADAGAQAIAMTAYGGSLIGKVSYKDTGIMAREVTGLGTVGSTQLVRTSSTGRLERVSSYTAGDDIVGFAEKDGRVHLLFGLPWSMISAIAGVAPYSIGTAPYPTQGELARWGVPATGAEKVLIAGWFPSINDAGAFDIGQPIISATDNTVDTVTLKFGSRDPDAGEFVQTIVEGNNVSLLSYDGGGNLFLAGIDTVASSSYSGCYISYRLAVGSSGSGASFGGAAAGPMIKLHKRITAPTGNPTDATSPAVWIWLEDPTTDGVKIKFPSGNIAIIDDVDGTLLTSASPQLTTPWIADSTGGQFYKVVVSNLSADRNVTMPLLTASDTFVFEAHIQTLSNKTISAPTISGAVVLSGASTSTTNNTKGTATDFNPVNVQTTNATATQLDSIAIPTNSVLAVSWFVAGIKSDLTKAVSYTVAAVFKNSAGSCGQIESTTATKLGSSDAAYAVTADLNGTSARLLVTGKASETIQWSAICTSLSVIP